MDMKIEITNGSSEQQEARLQSEFVSGLIEFLKKEIWMGSRFNLGIDEGVEWNKRTLIFSTTNKVKGLEELQNQRNKLNRQIAKLKKKSYCDCRASEPTNSGYCTSCGNELSPEDNATLKKATLKN